MLANRIASQPRKLSRSEQRPAISSRNCSARLGISLLEVLISLAVVSIGLLGIAILLPVAGKAARDGAYFDHATRVGQNALREFHLRGYGQWQGWYSADNAVPPIVVQNINNPNTKTCNLIFGNNPSYEAFVDDREPGPMGATSLNQTIFYDTGDTLVPNDPGYQGIDFGNQSVRLARHKKAFCIDPRFYAAQIAAGNINIPSASGNRATYFPYFAVTAIDQPRLKRITIRNSAGAGPMSKAQADGIFMATDDIVFDRPQDPLLFPKQVFSKDPTTNSDIIREYEGRLSWFATIVPRTTMLADQQELYTLSVVVCKGRSMALDDDEEIALVQGIPPAVGGGIGGGEMVLTAYSGTSISLKHGDWLMLARYHDFGTGFEPLFKWYRVTATDGASTAAATVNVTLQGPDWNFHPNLKTYAFLVKDVVGVYERTIRLDTSSLWGY